MDKYDALILVSFGGPEGPADVIPFLENVLRGRPVPRERLLEVAEHYQRFGGVSPINAQNRQLIAALEQALRRIGIQLPIYFGNRNWHPLLADTVRQMAEEGVQRGLAVVTSAFSSYSGCRQYRENIENARRQVGPSAPPIDKLRVFYNHPGFVQANAQRLLEALQDVPPSLKPVTRIVFTAHSIPESMAATCSYQQQLEEACRLVAEQIHWQDWALVYQSRSGSPQQAWLEPDVCDYVELASQEGLRSVIIAPIGFLSDHIEVLYDLDIEVRGVCDRLGMAMVRAATVGTHPVFVEGLCQLIQERLTGATERCAVGAFGPSHDVCPEDCCPRMPAAGVAADRLSGAG